MGVVIANPGTRDFTGRAVYGHPDLGADESSLYILLPRRHCLLGWLAIGSWTRRAGEADSSGSANTLSESAATISGAAGKISNGALLVRSSGKYLTRASTSSLTMGNVDFSIAFWVKLNSINLKQTFIAKGGSPYWEYSTFLEVGGGNDNKFGAYMDSNAGMDWCITQPWRLWGVVFRGIE